MEVETEMLDSAKENGSSTNQEVKKNSDTSSMERREKTYVWLCGVLTLNAYHTDYCNAVVSPDRVLCLAQKTSV